MSSSKKFIINKSFFAPASSDNITFNLVMSSITNANVFLVGVNCYSQYENITAAPGVKVKSDLAILITGLATNPKLTTDSIIPSGTVSQNDSSTSIISGINYDYENGLQILPAATLLLQCQFYNPFSGIYPVSYQFIGNVVLNFRISYF